MNWQKLKLALAFMLSPLIINSGNFPMGPISDEELRMIQQIEQEIANMSPEEQAALNAEIEDAINSLPEDQRAQLLEEAARYEQELMSAFQEVGPQQQAPQMPQQPQIPQPKAKETKPDTKTADEKLLAKLEVALKKLDKGLEAIELAAATSPSLKARLEQEDSWHSFQEHADLLGSLVKAAIKNKDIKTNLLNSEWEKLQADITSWGENLELIINIAASDNEDGYSRAEADQAAQILTKFLGANPVENTVWSLKRLFQKYAEEELKKAEEKAAALAKQPYRFPQARRGFTDTPRLAPPRTAPQQMSRPGKAYVAPTQPLVGPKKPEMPKEEKPAEKPKDSSKKDGKKDVKKKKDIKPEKKIERRPEARTSTNEQRAEKPKEQKPTVSKDAFKGLLKRQAAKLEKQIKAAGDVAIKLEASDGSKAEISGIIKDELKIKLADIRNSLANIQLALAPFCTDGELEGDKMAIFTDLIGSKVDDDGVITDKPLNKVARKLAELKKIWAQDIKSGALINGHNSTFKDKRYKDEKEHLKDLPGGVPRDSKKAETFEDYLAEVTDRLLTLAAVSENKDEDYSKEMLKLLEEARS